MVDIQVGVSINRGLGFKRIAGPTEVGAGDAVMVSYGGSAQIVYSDTCLIDVYPGAVIRVATSSPCLSQPTQQTSVPLLGRSRLIRSSSARVSRRSAAASLPACCWRRAIQSPPAPDCERYFRDAA